MTIYNLLACMLQLDFLEEKFNLNGLKTLCVANKYRDKGDSKLQSDWVIGNILRFGIYHVFAVIGLVMSITSAHWSTLMWGTFEYLFTLQVGAGTRYEIR